ncbi:MAG: hypothetical protein EAZ61_13385, partial [Oscillatoriales cyanobacterium]
QLEGKTVTWQQRLCQGATPIELNWETQRFDEQFVIASPELKGITVFWSKAGETLRRDMTASRLELDRTEQVLYITPKSQPEVVVRVGVPQPKYESITLTASVVTVAGNTLVIRDRGQMLEVRASLSATQIAQLKADLA